MEISDKPGQGEGGGLSKTGRPEKSKSPKNKYRNYSIMSNFTTVFTCTYYIKIIVVGTVLQCVITVVFSYYLLS